MPPKPYDLFLFDLDDTLLDFGASEVKAFGSALSALGYDGDAAALLPRYQAINLHQWVLFEQGRTTKERLKTERFRLLFEEAEVGLDADRMSAAYVEALSQTAVLMDYAEELCAWLSGRGEIGIVTNGIREVQYGRIRHSPLAPYIRFICVSEECGYAKPDARFFEHMTTLANRFHKPSALMIGDRLEADILGARNFGMDSCWFNPKGYAHPEELTPTYTIRHLSQLRELLEAA